MALKFNDSKGAAQKSNLVTYNYEDGKHTVRIVGDILPRYVYWLKGENNKNIPVECLAFNRDEETFDNAETDWVAKYYPDLNCSWGYVTQCIHDGQIKVLNLKRKLWDQIRTAAEDLGDPTDPETGWDIVYERKKTGPLPFNVEYSLHVLKCKNRPLNEKELALLEDLKSMDEVMPRPKPAQQKEFLDRLRGNANEEVDHESLEQEFKVD